MMLVDYMKNKKELREKIPFLLLCVLCFFPLFNVNLTSQLVTFFFITSVILNFKKGVNALKIKSKKPLIINCLFFFVLIVSIFYSSNINEAQKTLLRQISFLLFPLVIFYFLQFKKKDLVIFSKLFVLANALSVIFLIYHISKTDSILNIINDGFNFRSLINKKSYKVWHPAYIALFILTSQFLIIKNIFYLKRLDKKIVSIVLLLFFSFFLFMLNARSAIYSFILVIPFFIFLQLKSKKQRLIFIIILIPISGLLYYILATNFSLNYRLILQLEKIYHWFVYDEILKIGIDIRYYINICNMDVFKESPLLGHGVGDVKYLLRNCYLDNEFNKPFLKGLNSHNSYFYLLLSGGILALFSFLFLIMNNLFVSFKQNNYLYIAILCTLMIVFISENYLVRFKGILFFAAVNAILYYDMNILTKKHDIKE